MNTARAMWILFEPVHAVTYFHARSRTAFEAAGLRGFWRGYFAGRAAPLGPVGAAPVVAAFFSFAPSMVERALPAVWELAPPAAALLARAEGAVEALAELTADLPPDHIAEVADLLSSAVAGIAPRPPANPATPPETGERPPTSHEPAEKTAHAKPTNLITSTGTNANNSASTNGAPGSAGFAGRVLSAANAALREPTEPLARLWHAATILREHRGDGHVAALVTAGLDGAETLAWRCGIDLSADALRPARGWSDDQWAAAIARLAARGLLTPEGRATQSGVDLHRSVEETTDRLAAAPWEALGPERTVRLRELLAPISVACRSTMPTMNLLGLAPAPA